MDKKEFSDKAEPVKESVLPGTKIPAKDAEPDQAINIAHRLTVMAQKYPEEIAIAEPRFTKKRWGLFSRKPLRDNQGKRLYKTITFRELDQDSDRIAQALLAAGFEPGMKIALMVRMGIDFISLVFALFKAGTILILIDPGMGVKKMLQCLREADPDGFAAIPAVHTVRKFLPGWFPHADKNLIVGGSSLFGKLTLSKIRKRSWEKPVLTAKHWDDPAAIIFTSGSTGPAKGVLYTHRIFNTQVDEIAARYEIVPGAVDLAGFPFFGLFNAAMGTTAIIPDMDPTRPASVDPVLFLEAANDWKITQSFGSPALWNRVVHYCKENGKSIPTLKRAISAGAPVPFRLLEDFIQCIHPEGNIYTPYGATESLPVASIDAHEILEETANKTRLGAGICVGRRFSKIEWKILPITDQPIEHLEEVEPLPPGKIGELTVCGPQITARYITRVEANKTAKIRDQYGRIWHRIGDVGYLDEQDRFWFCGRKAHRAETKNGPLFSIPCEAIANEHPRVFRSALVGIPAESEEGSEPVIIVEPFPEYWPKNQQERDLLIKEVLALLEKSEITRSIRKVLIHPKFPVDIRHNAKINREQLAQWAKKYL
ncbi:MAG: fatty acid CoA ligase family protein [Planctomycetia bacterium]|nr:fatty acid CoA ligase family protein [Planctomycetia bacterium]